MALDRFNDDLNFVGNLGDDPKRDDGLSTPQFKSYFDKAGLAIQRFINNKLIPQIESAIDEGALLQQIAEVLNRKLDKAGGVMTGNIDMNGQKLSGLNAPTADDEAATKGFVENAVKNVDVSGKVDKVNVVNNFLTTEEGFVADARALKVLNDKISFVEYPKNSGENNELSIDFKAYDNGVYEVLTIRSYAMVVKSSTYINCGNALSYSNDSIIVPTMTNGVLKIDVGEWYGHAYIRALI